VRPECLSTFATAFASASLPSTRAGREQTETAILGWCSGFLIAGSVVVMFVWPSEGRLMLVIGTAGAVLALRRDFVRLWKDLWKKHDSESRPTPRPASRRLGASHRPLIWSIIFGSP
jgi:hypothetical protein